VSLFLLSMISSNGPATALDAVRLSLEANSAFWFRLVKIAGYAVAFGCVLEAPETFLIIKRWWLLRFRDVEREETKADKKSWIVPLAAAGLIIIVVGIVLETYFEGKVSDADAEIREHESQVVSTAESDAAKAIERAAANEKEAVAQRVRADEDEKKLVQSQIDLLTLRKSTLPRTIDVNRVASKIKLFAGTLLLIRTLSDLELANLAGLIRQSALKANWKCGEMFGGNAPEFAQPGIWIEVSPPLSRGGFGLAPLFDTTS